MTTVNWEQLEDCQFVITKPSNSGNTEYLCIDSETKDAIFSSSLGNGIYLYLVSKTIAKDYLENLDGKPLPDRKLVPLRTLPSHLLQPEYLPRWLHKKTA